MSTVDLVLFVAVEALALTFIALSISKRSFRRYLYLNVYTAAMVGCDVGRTLSLRAFGLKSIEYFLAYYLTDFLLVVLLYMAILSVFDIVLQDSPFRAQARLAFIFFFAIVAGVSYAFVSNSRSLFNGRSILILEFQQNMYFASVVLTALMCISLVYLRVQDPQLRMVVGALGVMGALQAAQFAFSNLLPKEFFKPAWEVIKFVGPVATVTMLAMWCYALTRVKAAARVEAPAEKRLRDLPFAQALSFSQVMAKAEARS